MNSFMSLALGLPVVHAETTTSNEETPRKVKVSSIPLYPEPEKWEFSAKPTSWLENVVKDTRVQATTIKAEYQPVLDRACHIIDTGRAHTNEALAHLRAEGNIASQMGAVAFGGILGLVAARRRGFFKKFTYFFIGVGGAGAVCYPEQAKIVAGNAGDLALKNARIAYHFVVGARPTVQNENGKPFERTLNIVSDIGKWGLGLFEKGKSQVPQQENVDAANKVEKAAEEVPQPIIQEEKTEEEAPKVEPVFDSPVPETFPETPLDTLTSNIETPVDSTASAEPVNEVTNEKASDKQENPGEEIGSKSTAAYEDLGQGTPEDKELYTTRE